MQALQQILTNPEDSELRKIQMEPGQRRLRAGGWGIGWALMARSGKDYLGGLRTVADLSWEENHRLSPVNSVTVCRVADPSPLGR